MQTHSIEALKSHYILGILRVKVTLLNFNRSDIFNHLFTFHKNTSLPLNDLIYGVIFLRQERSLTAIALNSF